MSILRPKDIRALYSVKDYPTESAMFIGTEGALLLEHRARADSVAGGEVRKPSTAQVRTARSLPSFRGRLPRTGEERIVLRANRPDDRGDFARHGGNSRSRQETGMESPAHEGHEQRRREPFPETQDTAKAGTRADFNFCEKGCAHFAIEEADCNLTSTPGLCLGNTCL